MAVSSGVCRRDGPRPNYPRSGFDHGYVYRLSRCRHAWGTGGNYQHLSSVLLDDYSRRLIVGTLSHEQGRTVIPERRDSSGSGLLVAAGISIGRAGIHTWMGLMIMILAGIVLVRFRPNAVWVIFGAGILRLILGLVLG